MRKETIIALAAQFLALAVPACGSSGDTQQQQQTVVCMGTNVVAAEANDYSFSSTLTFPPVKIKPSSDLTFDWSAVTSDFLGHAVNPRTDLMLITVMPWSLNLNDLQTKLNADTLKQRDLVVVPATFTPTGGNTTSANLLSFTLNGMTLMPSDILPYFDPTMYPPDSHTYTLMASSGTTLGQGVRMIQSFQLDSTSTNTMVTMKSDSTHLDYHVSLHDLKATGIKAGQAGVTLDWGNMTTNALGNQFTTTNITNVLVGHYAQTPAQLESQFLDIQLIATELYQGCVGDAPCTIPSGTSVDFSQLKTSAGQSFPGIDSTGTWIVALQCGGCRNPAPWYLSILKPCSP